MITDVEKLQFLPEVRTTDKARTQLEQTLNTLQLSANEYSIQESARVQHNAKAQTLPDAK